MLLSGVGLAHFRWNKELTLKCKLKCYVKPMKDPLGVSPSKGNQGTREFSVPPFVLVVLRGTTLIPSCYHQTMFVFLNSAQWKHHGLSWGSSTVLLIENNRKLGKT